MVKTSQCWKYFNSALPYLSSLIRCIISKQPEILLERHKVQQLANTVVVLVVINSKIFFCDTNNSLSLQPIFRKAFDKLVKETIRQKGVDAGHVDVIRSLRNIKDSKQFFNDAYKVNKELNKNNVRISLTPDGEILLNDGKATTPTELRNNLKLSPSEDVFANLPTIPESHPAAAKVNFNENLRIFPTVSKEHVIMVVKGLFQLGTFIKCSEDLESVLIDFAERVTLYVFDSFVDFMKSYFSENSRRIGGYLNVAIPFEDVLMVALNIIRNLSESSGVDMDRYLEQIDWNFLRLQINEFYDKLRVRMESRGKPNEQCKICSGSFYG